MEKIRIGLVGCGAIAQFAHLPALVKADNVELNALCESCEDILKTIGVRYNLRNLFTDYKTFLATADIDAVILAVPDRFHVNFTVQALEAGKHVLLEKPLGINVEECKKLVEIVKKSKKIVQVGSMKRHDPGIEYAKRFITEEIGERLSVNAWYCDSYYRYQIQHTLLPHLIKSKKSVHERDSEVEDKEEFYLRTHGIHLVDTIQYLAGPIHALQAKITKKFDCYSWHCLLEFSDGALGHLELTVHIKSDWDEGFIVHGEYGSVYGKTFLPFFRRASSIYISDLRKAKIHTPIAPDSDPYERQLESFARSILYGEKINPCVEDGLMDVKVLEAIKSSISTGKRIEII